MKKKTIDEFGDLKIIACPGIYAIVNIKNNHKYVGQTTNLIERKKRHFYDLKTNHHINPYLQNAYNSYGQREFKLIVLEYCQEFQLDLEEQYWIERLKPEYNIVKNHFNNPKAQGNTVTDYIRFLGKEDDFIRPAWHAWVYGGARNPILDARK